MPIENKKGHFRFLKGSAPYSSGAIAMEGREVVHVTLAPIRPYKEGFAVIDRHLKQQGLPQQALCGIELRSPRPFSFGGFGDFNEGYIAQIKSRDLLVEGLNPVARTNVAPEVGPPREPSMYAFSYVAPSKAGARTFVVAGAGELTEGAMGPEAIVRRGDVSESGLREKAAHVLGIMDDRLKAMGVSWAQVTVAEVYTVHNIFPLMKSLLMPRLGAAGIHGVRWHFARPPVEEIEFEMDVRGVLREIVL